MTHETHEYLTTPDALRRALSRVGVGVVRVEYFRRSQPEMGWRETEYTAESVDFILQRALKHNNYRAVLRAPEVEPDGAKPTAGPWIVEDKYPSEVQTADLLTVATVWHEHAVGQTIELCGVLPCSLEESAANARLIADAGTTYHATGRTPSELAAEVERLKAAGMCELAATNPNLASYAQHWESRAESAEERVRVLEEALRPFAELAALFDDGRRGCTMPSADDHNVMSWPRLDRDYALTVGHLRSARAALSAVSKESDK